MSGAITTLRLEVGPGPGGDAEELDQLTRGLRAELLELDLDGIDLAPAGNLPTGAKSGAGVEVGSLLVRLSDSAVLVALVRLLKSWIGRGSGRSVSVQFGEDKITVGRASDEEVAQLIGSWINRHDRQ
jgi:hypothetical protein